MFAALSLVAVSNSPPPVELARREKKYNSHAQKATHKKARKSRMAKFRPPGEDEARKKRNKKKAKNK